MTDDEWWAEQDRRHNAESYRHITTPPVKPKRLRPRPFTLEQLLVAERWANNQESRTA